MLNDFRDEFARYKMIGEKAMAQVGEQALNRCLQPGTNSIAMLVRHISGNLRSRFTDFMTSDGEKPWRDRDAEFDECERSRAQLDAMWEEAWKRVFDTLAQLSDADLERMVAIRGQPLTVHAALARSTAHTATHIGQIVLLARVLADREWVSLSIPKGASQRYNQNPTREKRPD